MKKGIKEKLTIENLLCLMIIISPILDMSSFLFREFFGTTFSIATFIRPIIPIIVILIIFFKEKMKLKLLGVASVYGIYSLIHLFLFTKLKNEIAFGGVVNELQYIVNYSFMILNLFIFTFIFKGKDIDKIKKSLLISITIYITSVWLAIITKTSTTTYIEGIGQKGWFATGNNLGTVLILSMFIILNMIKNKKYRYWAIGVFVLVGIYTTTLLGTRVGLFGFIATLLLYAISEITAAMLKRSQLNIKILIGSLCTIAIIVVVVISVGSSTLQRRKHLNDGSLQSENHISNALLEIKEKIDNNKIEEAYMSNAEKQSILDLYEFANSHNIKNNDMRAQQFIYHTYLMKNQHNIFSILFGNGYQAHFSELILEMEIPAFFFNFGIIGFTLYFVPIFAMFVYGIYIGIKFRKLIDAEYLMHMFGILFGFAFSFLSGYTFFHASSMLVVVILNVLLIDKIIKIKQS